MKKNLLLLPLLAIAAVCMTSCDLFDSIFGDNNPPDVLPDANGLLVYNNPNEAKSRFSGGGLDKQAPNTSEPQIKYDYDGLGDVNASGSLDYMPSTGNVNILVIPVEFQDYKDEPSEKDIKRKQIYSAYFGSPDDTGFESVSSYFAKSSYGSLQISGVVTEWYECNYDVLIEDEYMVADLSNEAFEWYKETYNSTGSEFDSDDDGYVDAICLIYNAPTHYYGNDNLWAYCFWRGVSRGTAKNPNVNAFFWASCSFMDNPLDRSMIDAHTYIHELGHVMGLEDYYNYAGNKRGSTGGFIMQDMNVGDHDPFSKLAFNWVQPTYVTGNTTIELRSFAETGQVLVFKPDNSDFISPFDEYLAVELYTPTGLNQHDSEKLLAPGYPKGPNAAGLRIWHVDSRLLKIRGEKIHLTNTYDSTARYTLAMSNTDSGSNSSIIPEFNQYKLLHCLQEGGYNTYTDGELFSKGDLWRQGDHFNMTDYSDFFVNPGAFNNNKTFGLNINVKSIINNVATLEVTF